MLVTPPFDTGIKPGANQPGGHTLRVLASAPSRAGAPDKGPERVSAAFAFWVAA